MFVSENDFDLDLKESIEAPPLSLSTPDLHNMSHHSPFHPLRRSASSSEILYEKAMQRFYQAVELDEAEMAKKRSTSIEPNSYSKINKNYTNSTDESDTGYSVDTRLVSFHYFFSSFFC